MDSEDMCELDEINRNSAHLAEIMQKTGKNSAKKAIKKPIFAEKAKFDSRLGKLMNRMPSFKASVTFDF